MGFLVSMALMFVEAFTLKYIGSVREQDMYLFLIPATFFGFAFISQMELPDHPAYIKLRQISSLVFYSHLWIKVLINKGFQLFDEDLSKTPLLFISTTLLSVVSALAIIKLSERKRFQWIKLLYT